MLPQKSIRLKRTSRRDNKLREEDNQQKDIEQTQTQIQIKTQKQTQNNNVRKHTTSVFRTNRLMSGVFSSAKSQDLMQTTLKKVFKNALLRSHSLRIEQKVRPEIGDKKQSYVKKEEAPLVLHSKGKKTTSHKKIVSYFEETKSVWRVGFCFREQSGEQSFGFETFSKVNRRAVVDGRNVIHSDGAFIKHEHRIKFSNMKNVAKKMCDVFIHLAFGRFVEEITFVMSGYALKVMEALIGEVRSNMKVHEQSLRVISKLKKIDIVEYTGDNKKNIDDVISLRLAIKLNADLISNDHMKKTEDIETFNQVKQIDISSNMTIHNIFSE